MLQLKNIFKRYLTGDLRQVALNDVCIDFRDSEFVCVLGPSGSGKTTLLNVIGGLDRYNYGDLVVDGVSTEDYKDRDWDGYRNHSIGFIFQSYNLIPHLSILKNVELALTIGGVSGRERKRRAKEALFKVGLDGQLHKKPNQLSGGQMQRVAIARALVNEPKILLADEPTGALDSGTSVQVMELLKEVAKDRLVIMVTHNPALAEQYATRIVNLQDGRIISDSNPFDGGEERAEGAQRKKDKSKMSLVTALSLSFNNLKTKKGRTLLTSFAGSIGIIGIALILALSSGVNRYIADLQRSTMTSYPVTVEEKSYDFTNMVLGSTLGGRVEISENRTGIYADHSAMETSAQLKKSVTENNLTQFKKYLDDSESEIYDYVGENGIVYGYNVCFGAWTRDADGAIISERDLTSDGSLVASGNLSYQQADSDLFSYCSELMRGQGSAVSPVITDSYEMLKGKWASDYRDVMLVLDENNAVDTKALYLLGALSEETYREIFDSLMAGEEAKELTFRYEELIGKEILLSPACDSYRETQEGIFRKIGEKDEEFSSVLEQAVTLNICGVVKAKADNKSGFITSPLAYTSLLTDYVIARTDESEVVKAQEQTPTVNVLTGQPFGERESLKDNLNAFGKVSYDAPASIRIYTDSFEAKEGVAKCIVAYNEGVEEADRITYTDYVELMTSSLTLIVNVITYVLIAFVAVSLVVSCLMIGIITHISVLERTKEIGILRSLGASKRNVSQVFHAETIIIGFIAGLLGVGITLLLTLPVNSLLALILGNGTVKAVLPWGYALALVGLSVLITLFGGLAPAKKAAKKQPVLALRTE